MKPVNLGVIGCGVIGNVHVESAKQSDKVRVAAVTDLRAEAAQALAHRHGVPRVHPSVQALLDDRDIEAIVLALPAGARDELAVQALSKGKHVLLEKPPATSVRHIRRMMEVRGSRVAACCSCRYRLFPAADAATTFLSDQPLGALRAIHCRAFSGASPKPEKTPPAWRLSRAANGGGILVNWGVYDLDYLLGLTGWRLRPRVVLARQWPVPEHLMSHVAPGSDAEAHISFMVLCDGGAAITFERGEYMSIRSEHTWQILGQRGSLRLQMTPEENAEIVHDRSGDDGLSSSIVWQGSDNHDGLGQRLLEDFADAIRLGRTPKTGLEQALVIQSIIDAAYASAASGAPVNIE